MPSSMTSGRRRKGRGGRPAGKGGPRSRRIGNGDPAVEVVGTVVEAHGRLEAQLPAAAVALPVVAKSNKQLPLVTAQGHPLSKSQDKAVSRLISSPRESGQEGHDGERAMWRLEAGRMGWAMSKE